MQTAFRLRASAVLPSNGIRCPRMCTPTQRHGSVVVYMAESVQDLLERDRRPKELAETAEFLPDAPKAEKASPSSSGKEVLKPKSKRREDLVKPLQPGEPPREYKRCKDAIDAGLKLFQEKQYAKAIDIFSMALELPGNGAYRVAGSPREYSCPSDAEEAAALYNMACCYAQMGQAPAAITCLEGVLDTGFDQYDTIRTDADLAPVRGPQLDALLAKYDGLAAKVTGLFGSKKKQTTDDRKPWILW